MQRRVVVTDHGFPDLDVEQAVLARVQAGVEAFQCRRPEEVIEAARDADALLVQFAPITPQVIGALERCQVIVRYGIGVDTVDLEAAARRGIPVVNVPDYALDEVADHALALLLTTVRKIPQVMRQVQAGFWETNPCRPMHSLSGKVLGLAGFGNIARRVCARAQAFGLRVVAHDPYLPEETFGQQGAEKVTWEELLEVSDLVSIHLPLTPETRKLFNDAAFSRMKEGAFLVNTSRGGVVDTDDLVFHLRSGRIAGAGLDVLEREPIEADSPLLAMPSLVITSHCAWYTVEALERLKRNAAEEIARVFSGEQPKHVVNAKYLL